MQNKFIDTHCHLYSAEFDDDRSLMVNRAIEAGVGKMMMPNIDLQSIPFMKDLAASFPSHCFPMIGLHPCSVDDTYLEKLKAIEKELSEYSYIGIGETGIDLYWDRKFESLQLDAFERQIEMAKDKDLPVIIHSRESLELNIRIIQKHQNGKLRGIFHCFGGTEEQGRQIDDLGFKVGIGGIVTFKNSSLKDVLPKLALSSIVLETDAPYLAPVPFRGKRNEPAYLPAIAEIVAGALGFSIQELSEVTNRNAWEVFGKKT